LSGANLSDANLSNADLENANLTNADLAGTKLTGANLKGAKGLVPAETEIEVLKFIQDEIVSKGKLDMGDWHGDDDWREHPCNTTHCAAGSAQVYALLHKMPEAELQPEIAGSMLIPSVAHLFFATEEEFIAELELLLSGKKELLKR
jgi:hypothetical protein